MSSPLPATIGGRYRVVRRIGQGGMGAVYEALDERGTRVAIKVIVTELAHNATLVGRFEREAKAAGDIDTPHIARTLDTGTDPVTGQPYMVMELLDGEDIDQLQKRLGPLPNELALRIGAQACLALQKAHEGRILHRDIKPANLFLAKQGNQRIVKLLDFGVAKVRPEVTRSTAETAGLTRTGSMLGSPLYMSPEQARGYKDIDFRSDLWSLGIVLYKMLSGRTPHGDTEELGELIVLICTEPPEPIQDLAPWVPPQVAAVVHRALRFSPGERYASAAEMLASITALLPGGHAIPEELIRPLAEHEKVAQAPRLVADLTDAPAPRARTVPPGGVAAMTGGAAPSSSLTGGAVGSTLAPPGTMSGQITVATVATDPKKPAMPWIAVTVVVAIVLVGVAALRFTGMMGPPSGAQADPQGQTGAGDSKSRSVTVVILPSSAKVEVEGTAVALSDGLLEITGAVGSVHKVRVTAGGVEKLVRVVVSESGAVPPKIQVEGAADPIPTTTTTATAPLFGPKPKPKPSTTSAPGPAPTSDELRNKR